MDLFSLDSSPAQLVRSSNTINSMAKKIDHSQMRDAVQNQGNAAKSLFQDEELSSLGRSDQEENTGLSYISIHSSSIFFQSKVDLSQEYSDNIQIGKASFSKDEFNRCHELVQNVRTDLKSKEFLDYDDYAKQALLSNVVADFAKKNLNEEQAQVLNSAMNDYVVSQQFFAQENSTKEGIQESSFEGIRDYYGKSGLISPEQADYINASFDKIGLKTNVKAGTETVIPQATNEGIKQSLTDLFTNIDVNDNDQLNGALAKYKELLKPVYSSLDQEISSDDLNGIVEQKSKELMKIVQKYRDYTRTYISEYA